MYVCMYTDIHTDIVERYQLNLVVRVCNNLMHAVQALKDIAHTLGKKDWNFSVDPCSGEEGWAEIPEENAVTCNCSFSNGTVCHVFRMYVHFYVPISIS